MPRLSSDVMRWPSIVEIERDGSRDLLTALVSGGHYHANLRDVRWSSDSIQPHLHEGQLPRRRRPRGRGPEKIKKALAMARAYASDAVGAIKT